MKKLFYQILWMTLMMLGSACGHTEMENEEFYKTKMAENLKNASTWLIQDGVKMFSEKGKKGLHRKLVDEWGVLLWVDPWVESERYIDSFWIKARGINYQVTNFQRESLSSGIYEFWIVKINGTDWSGELPRSVFYVTKTDDIYGHREILKTSDQFIESYTVNNDTKIDFQTDEPKKLYEMQAWLFPENYKESDLKNTEAIMNEEGDIELIRLEQSN